MYHVEHPAQQPADALLLIAERATSLPSRFLPVELQSFFFGLGSGVGSGSFFRRSLFVFLFIGIGDFRWSFHLGQRLESGLRCVKTRLQQFDFSCNLSADTELSESRAGRTFAN